MRCLVKGCTNHDATDKAGDYLCPQCFIMLTTGLIGEGSTFAHELHDELLIAMVSGSTLFDGIASALFDALPTSASREL
jgi:hypothetical protein